MGLVRIWLATMIAFAASVAACYDAPSANVACKLRCTDSCPDGLRCVGGVCVGASGTCAPIGDGGADATSTCGAVGQACCAGATACGDNAFCSAGTCEQCVTDIALGRHHTCARKHDGTVWCAGSNDDGELGNNTVDVDSATHVQVTDATGPITDASAVATSGAPESSTSCAIRSGGTVWCWGGGTFGTLGNNTFISTPHAVQVVITGTLAPLTDIVELGVGAFHACGRDASSRVWCWGQGANGRLGDGTFSTRATAALVQDAAGAAFTNVNKLAVARAHNCVIANTTEIWCWGVNDTGRIGDGTFMDRTRPTRITTGTSVAGGRFHTCAAHLDGTASCWGDGWRDRIGDGANNTNTTPKPVLDQVGGAPLQGVAAIAAGGSSCALMMDGRVRCWGESVHGQLATAGGARIPAEVLDRWSHPLAVDRIIIGLPHTCVFTKPGALWCWGRNDDGEFGDGMIGKNWGVPTPYGLRCGS